MVQVHQKPRNAYLTSIARDGADVPSPVELAGDAVVGVAEWTGKLRRKLRLLLFRRRLAALPLSHLLDLPELHLHTTHVDYETCLCRDRL